MLSPPISTTSPTLLCTQSAATLVPQLSPDFPQTLRIAQYKSQDQPEERVTIYDGLTLSASAQLLQTLSHANDHEHFVLLTARDTTTESPLHIHGRAQVTERPTLDDIRVSLNATASSPRGPVLLSVTMRVRSGADAMELDRWYEEEHIGLLARIPGWKRTTRWIRIAADGSAWKRGVLKSKIEDEIELLALHEFEAENGLGGPEHLASRSTEWRDRVWRVVKGTRRRVLEVEEAEVG